MNNALTKAVTVEKVVEQVSIESNSPSLYQSNVIRAGISFQSDVECSK